MSERYDPYGVTTPEHLRFVKRTERILGTIATVSTVAGVAEYVIADQVNPSFIAASVGCGMFAGMYHLIHNKLSSDRNEPLE